jgi:hypothetical protein
MRITKSQVAYLGNTLNELLQGFNLGDFYFTIGSSRDAVIELADKLEDHYIACRDHEPRELYLSTAESLILRNASLLCSQRLTRNEFQTRLGAPLEELKKLLRLLEAEQDSTLLTR